MATYNVVQAAPGPAVVGKDPAGADYRDVPAIEAEYQKQLALRVADRINAISPFRRLVTTVRTFDDEMFVQRGNYYPVRPAIQAAGATLSTAYWLDPSTPATPPADATYSEVTLTPSELVAKITLSNEFRSNGYAIATDGQIMSYAGQSGADPTVVRDLADALNYAEAVALIASPGTAITSPQTGILHTAGITSGTATTSTGIDDTMDAVATILGRRRRVTAIMIGPALAAVWRKAKGSNLYLFPPSQPMSLFDRPVVVNPAMSDGTIVLGDWEAVLFAVRPTKAMLPVQVARSDHYAFNKNVSVYRASEMVGWAVLPGPGTESFYVITGVSVS